MMNAGKENADLLKSTLNKDVEFKEVRETPQNNYYIKCNIFNSPVKIFVPSDFKPESFGMSREDPVLKDSGTQTESINSNTR